MTQEVLDFCAHKNILLESEMIRMCDTNSAFERLECSGVVTAS